MGPSNSGKSTLATAVARARDLVAIHLDQLHHQPRTDWHPRPDAEFLALHDEAILGDRWAMDGNYARCLPQRLARATGAILLDVPTALSLHRYVRRCWFERRLGGLGGRDSVKWAILHHIAVATRRNRRRYDELFDAIALPKIRLASPRAIDHFQRTEALGRAGSHGHGG